MFFLQRVWRRLWSYTQPELQWFLLYHFGEGLCTDLSSYKRLLPPIDRVWADPFVIYQDGRHFVFIEEMIYRRYRGHISVFELYPDGSHTRPVPVIEKAYHLSYPFLLEINDTLFMIPESKQNRTIDLYECVCFPYEWCYSTTLMYDIDAVDATIWRQPDDDCWWMFVNIASPLDGSTWRDLHLYSAQNPIRGPWLPHPINPVVSDVTRARPAGNLFQQNGRLYRPSQDCGPDYGYALKINEILRLDTTAYVERVSSKIDPDPGENLRGIHTINYANGLSVADGKRHKFRHLL